MKYVEYYTSRTGYEDRSIKQIKHKMNSINSQKTSPRGTVGWRQEVLRYSLVFSLVPLFSMLPSFSCRVPQYNGRENHLSPLQPIFRVTGGSVILSHCHPIQKIALLIGLVPVICINPGVWGPPIGQPETHVFF